MAKAKIIIPQLSEKQIKHFWSKVIIGKSNECWPWIGHKIKQGYGHVKFKGKTLKTHRVAYIIYFGPLTDPTINILHKCDNPPCCNPNHLFKGTDADNMADMVRKGRSLAGNRNPSHLHSETRPRGNSHYLHIHPEFAPRGEKNKNSKLTDNIVREIKKMLCMGYRQIDIATKFGVVQPTISEIKLGNLWTHVK